MIVLNLPETITAAVLTVEFSYNVGPGHCMSFLALVEGEGYFGSAAHGCKRSLDDSLYWVDRRLETGFR
jgi:hypothetical protein